MGLIKNTEKMGNKAVKGLTNDMKKLKKDL